MPPFFRSTTQKGQSMKMYKAEALVKLASGLVKLNEKQADARLHNLGYENKDEGIYKIINPIQFKAGEVFGYDGKMPRVMQELVSEPTEEVAELEEMAKEEIPAPAPAPKKKVATKKAKN